MVDGFTVLRRYSPARRTPQQVSFVKRPLREEPGVPQQRHRRERIREQRTLVIDIDDFGEDVFSL